MEIAALEFTRFLGLEKNAGNIHEAVLLQLTKTLMEVQELLLYSQVKQVK
ncbi:hypothetical protein [Paenibacillus sp. N3.4]|nr:hypothetical protein [Paenibacillus sp. N3.4]